MNKTCISTKRTFIYPSRWLVGGCEMYVLFRHHEKALEKANKNFLFMQSVSKCQGYDLRKLIYRRTRSFLTKEKPKL